MQGFRRVEKAFGRRTADVYIAGEGPGVLLLHEIPGLHPDVIRFGRDLVDAGFTVWMPDLYGKAERPASPLYHLTSIGRVCMSRQFALLRGGRNSPLTNDLRHLGRQLADATGGSIGAVGMCLTGGFALALAVDPWLDAPVLSQPSLPFGIFPWLRGDLGIDTPTLDAVKERARCGLCVLGLRYTGDPMVPGARFERLRNELGDAFEAVELAGRQHSVLARDRHEPSVQRTIAFLRENLEGTSS